MDKGSFNPGQSRFFPGQGRDKPGQTEGFLLPDGVVEKASLTQLADAAAPGMEQAALLGRGDALGSAQVLQLLPGLGTDRAFRIT